MSGLFPLEVNPVLFNENPADPDQNINIYIYNQCLPWLNIQLLGNQFNSFTAIGANNRLLQTA